MWLLALMVLLLILALKSVFKEPVKSAFCEKRHEWESRKQEEGDYLICSKCHYLPASQAFGFVDQNRDY